MRFVEEECVLPPLVIISAKAVASNYWRKDLNGELPEELIEKVLWECADVVADLRANTKTVGITETIKRMSKIIIKALTTENEDLFAKSIGGLRRCANFERGESIYFLRRTFMEVISADYKLAPRFLAYIKYYIGHYRSELPRDTVLDEICPSSDGLYGSGDMTDFRALVITASGLIPNYKRTEKCLQKFSVYLERFGNGFSREKIKVAMVFGNKQVKEVFFRRMLALNNAKTVGFVLENCDAKDADKLLHYAVVDFPYLKDRKKRRLEIIRKLIDVTTNHRTPAKEAAYNGYAEVVEVFLEKGTVSEQFLMENAALDSSSLEDLDGRVRAAEERRIIATLDVCYRSAGYVEPRLIKKYASQSRVGQWFLSKVLEM